HPYTDYQAHEPSHIDVRANSDEGKSSKTISSLTADKSTRTSTAGLDLLHTNDKSHDSAADDENSKDEKSKTAKKSASYQLPPIFKKSSGSQVDPRLKWLLGDQADAPVAEYDQQGMDTAVPNPDTDRRSSGNQSSDNTSGKTAMRNPGGGQAGGT